jgi:hypothetical protein
MPAVMGFPGLRRDGFLPDRDRPVPVTKDRDAAGAPERTPAPCIDDACIDAFTTEHQRHVRDWPLDRALDVREGRFKALAQIAIERAIVGVVDLREGRTTGIEPMVVRVDKAPVMRTGEFDEHAALHIPVQTHIAGGLTFEAIGAKAQYRRCVRDQDANCVAGLLDPGEEITQRLDLLSRLKMIGVKRVPDGCGNAQLDSLHWPAPAASSA